MEKAATKIQAGFRGFKARKQIKLEICYFLSVYIIVVACCLQLTSLTLIHVVTLVI